MSKSKGYFYLPIGGSSAAVALVVALGVLNYCGGNAWADSLAYSFESASNDGFHATAGGGITVTQDTIGATLGTHSMKIAVAGGATFVGAETSVLDTTTIGNSAIVGNPPGIDHVTFDLTLPSQFPPDNPANPGTPLPGFGVIGMKIFGQQPDSTPIDAQFQDNEIHIDGLSAGTHLNVRMDLTSALLVSQTGSGPGGSFNDLFGTGLRPDGGPKLIPTGVQFYFNKTAGNSQYALTLYLDNVRFGMTVAGDYNGNGIVDAADYTVWRDTLGSTTDLRANGDNTGASVNLIDQADYTFWKSRFGATSGSGALSSGAVPEPRTAVLLLVGGICWLRMRQSRAARWNCC
jgi:hypothetical protein